MSQNYNLAVNRTAYSRRANSQRRWTIVCKNGEFETLSITQPNAQEVARWCDKNHPDCRPHILEDRRKSRG